MEKSETKKEIELSKEKMPAVLEYKRLNGTIRVEYEKEEEELSDERAIKDVVFTQDNGRQISFRRDLSLPDDISIIELHGFWRNIIRYLPDKKGIVFSKFIITINSENNEKIIGQFFEAEGALYAFLHEIGHIFHPPDERYKELEDLKIDDKLTDGEIEEYNRIVIGAERDAHNFAIKKLRQLRRERINLEPDLKTLGDIGRFAHQALAKYEIRRKKKSGENRLI